MLIFDNQSFLFCKTINKFATIYQKNYNFYTISEQAKNTSNRVFNNGLQLPANILASTGKNIVEDFHQKK